MDDKAPDPGMLWLAIGIGVFSVLASFMLAIYYAGSEQASAAPLTADASPEVSARASPSAEPILQSAAATTDIE
ncbi:hypothetical protein INR77_12800 [Erythrobacter sp. SCSIO 43205]|uniref:hypothetical protein n=1 Tax=Erythrobacter sp. SCSIO 43205 TaxID=2779361 RepID=UPI001CA82295|nr:hypothetical protein [Erythrobacter sp. SCSIO 43205]UAB77656.1 hypothetical protein INR77_12800 [Erythrobacter sp. SCSIO 43205]